MESWGLVRWDFGNRLSAEFPDFHIVDSGRTIHGQRDPSFREMSNAFRAKGSHPPAVDGGAHFVALHDHEQFMPGVASSRSKSSENWSVAESRSRVKSSGLDQAGAMRNQTQNKRTRIMDGALEQRGKSFKRPPKTPEAAPDEAGFSEPIGWRRKLGRAALREPAP